MDSKCVKIRGLNWYANSCYLDSVMLALFATPSSFTTKILNMTITGCSGCNKCGHSKEEDLEYRTLIQKQLKKIEQSIRGDGQFVSNCMELRQLFKNCPNSENFWDGKTKDASDFLTYLIDMFMDSKHILVNISDIRILKNNEKDIHTSELVNTDKIHDSLFVINLNRRNQRTAKFIQTVVIPDEIIMIKNTKYTLMSSVIFDDKLKHYTCVFKCGNNWYYFNDNNGAYSVTNIGNYSDMLSHTPFPVLTQATLHYYKTR